ncbi:hypothetical protein SAMN02799624_05423 [Paenibacillus sp. UNC496MF]|uniref:hypothetical protein n=1 Tax=Paenibacillus sp. UNC496MF TaxID=1502753 RepID=UPI0008E2DCA7|nr:hypothetical protein [Paenibacillus sp. UNC496MF]SFJ65904.1 hypothetical protein SAMN02799624_05423 [Paenibacillus sp. UNC496MF]
MDIIAYGVANKAAKDEKNTRNNILGTGVTGAYPHAKDRIDALEAGIQNAVAKANELIINDAINIMKANAKLNVVAKTIRYKHQNMIFEDFLDASGIDAGKSSSYTLDTTNGLVKASGSGSYTIVTTQELADVVPEKAILVVEENESPTIAGTYSISRDDGVTWETISPESLFYFTAKSPQDKKLRLKAVLPANAQLLNYGLTWS